jgi:hypothetical protein
VGSRRNGKEKERRRKGERRRSFSSAARVAKVAKKEVALMRRMIMLFTVAALMAVMVVVNASPAFADPIEIPKGQSIAQLAKSFLPTDPVIPPNPIRGQLISEFARTGECSLCGGDDTPPSP